MSIVPTMVHLLKNCSDGLRLAAEHGPTSGVMLEYVCRNAPSGRGVVGRFIDGRFLRLANWQHARERIRATREIVAEIVAARHAANHNTLILDVASGTAPYLRALVREDRGQDLTVVCHDRDPRQVMLGRELAAAERLPRFTFSVGDATDQSSYLMSRDPDVLLAIHLFPYLSRDSEVRTVLKLAFEHLSAGGVMVCTTLAHPLPGSPYWVADAFGRPPTVRAPALVRGWLEEAGFRDIDERASQPGEAALIASKPLPNGS